MSLTVLNVAYPLAPVGPDAVGGAEQVLTRLDRALVQAGHASLVVACEGSQTSGLLFATPLPPGPADEVRRAEVQLRHRAVIEEVLSHHAVDVVHLHGIDFPAYLPSPGPAVLATLHLPPAWYPHEVFEGSRPRTWVHCVSGSQEAACPRGARLAPVIENGVPVDDLQAVHGKRGYVLALGRVCWEKGFHLALDAARRAGLPLLLAGEVFPYPAHRDYFESQVRPRLDRHRRFLGAIGFARKRRLLTAARALVVPSLVPETSSLVAMEALACGTPVVALRNGALPGMVEHGRTGFLVDTPDEMAEALLAAAKLDPEVCRETARRRFSVDRMVQRYLETYEILARAPAAEDPFFHADPHAA